MKLLLAIGLTAILLAGRIQADDPSSTSDQLCSAPWHTYIFEGGGPAGSYSMTRVFSKDGTFITQEDAKLPGTWSVTGDKVTLVYPTAKNQKDTISLPLKPDGTIGTDWLGKPTLLVQEQPAPPPPSPELQQQAAELASHYQADIALLSGSEGATSVFIASMLKSNFVITNVGAMRALTNASFKKIDNTPLPTGAASIAVGGDLMCFATSAGGTAPEIMDDVEKNAAVGDDVMVMNSSGGQGVMGAPFIGKLLAIKPDRIELNAPFTAASAGSPIIHIKSGKLIGIAYGGTPYFDATTGATLQLPLIRRCGLRMENVKSWQNVDMRAFYAQSTVLDGIEKTTRDMSVFGLDMQATKGGAYKPRARYASQAMKDCVAHWQKMVQPGPKGVLQSRDLQNLVTDVKNLSQSDMAVAAPRVSYDYFVRKLKEQQKIRDGLAAQFEKLINNFSY